MNTLLVFCGMAVVTFLTRYLMIAALGQEMPSWLRRWLRYVPPAVLTALIVPPVLTRQERLEVGTHTWAALVGAFVAWRTRSAFWTIMGGVAAFWLFRVIGM